MGRLWEQASGNSQGSAARKSQPQDRQLDGRSRALEEAGPEIRGLGVLIRTMRKC